MRGTARQRWLPDQAQSLLDLRAQGLPQSAIAEAMGLTKGKVSGMLRRLGLSQPKPAVTRPVAELIAVQETKPKTPPEKPRDICKPALVQTRICADERCFWPLGVPGTKEFHFCGKQIFANYPYCVDHARVAYERAPSLKKAKS